MVNNNRLKERGMSGGMRQRQATLIKWVSRDNNIGNYNNASSHKIVARIYLNTENKGNL